MRAGIALVTCLLLVASGAPVAGTSALTGSEQHPSTDQGRPAWDGAASAIETWAATTRDLGPLQAIAADAQRALGHAHTTDAADPGRLLSAFSAPREAAGTGAAEQGTAHDHVADVLDALPSPARPIPWTSFYRTAAEPMGSPSFQPATLADTDLSRALGLALAQPRQDPTTPPQPWPRFETPAAAMAALGHAPTPEEARQLSQLEPELAGALTTVLEAGVFLQHATEVAQRADTLDVGLLQAARDTALERILPVVPVFAQPSSTPVSINDCPSPVKIDFFVVEQSSTASTQSVGRCDRIVSIDSQGDDTYRNNAGGAERNASIFIDVSGDDDYVPEGTERAAVNGGAFQGVGILIDLQGGDTYRSSLDQAGALNGGALGGASFLFDGSGDDVYDANIVSTLPGARAAANGAALNGSALLYDAGGGDRYTADLTGTGVANGAGLTGVGALLDASGSDVYRATLQRGAANGAASNVTAPDQAVASLVASAPQQAGIPLVKSSAGTLFDGGGSDVYTADVAHGAANGAAGQGIGILLDGRGRDTYESTIAGDGAAQGAGVASIGHLVDLSGDDTYNASLSRGAAHGAGMFGAGLLADEGGSDTYLAETTGTAARQGAADVGIGVLADASGGNVFRAPGDAGPSTGAAKGLALADAPRALAGGAVAAPVLGIPDALGVLIGGTGRDTYEAAGLSQGAGAFGGVGILADPAGSNTYLAEAGSLAQGFGRTFGTGILLDRGANSSLTLAPGSAGQGAGQMGVGLVARPGATGAATYQAPASAAATAADGGGIGMIVDPATPGLTDRVARTCPTGQPIGPGVDVPGRTYLTVCPPDPATKRDIPHPVTGEPLGPQPKPPLDCDASAQTQAVCTLIANELGPGLVAWLERDNVTSTLSGGLAFVQGHVPEASEVPQEDSPDDGGLRGLLTTPSADRTCGAYCKFLDSIDI